MCLYYIITQTANELGADDFLTKPLDFVITAQARLYHSGEMISGNIGSSTLRRLDFTMIGDVVNTAQRLQSVAATGQIIINENAYDKIKQSFNCTKVSEVRLKNKANPVTIYNVVD